MIDEILTIETASAKMNVSTKYLRDCIRNGELKATIRSNKFFILYSDLIEFVRTGDNAQGATDKYKKKVTEG